MQTFREWLREAELDESRRTGRSYPGNPIMNAKLVYSGKLSKVIPELRKSFIFLGKKNGTKNIAIIGSAGGLEVNGFKYYNIDVGKEFEHYIDTGTNYKISNMKIVLHDVIKVDKDGNPNKEYKDEEYEYYVFK